MITDKLLHEKEVVFFGKIAASISHELNNVLSIINEYTGLIDDLCCTDKNSETIDVDRFQNITSHIAEQIKREQRLIKLLNRFAHRLDTPLAEFDLNELVNDIIALSQRFASMKKVILDFSPADGIICITNNPHRIQFAVFSCLQVALNKVQADDCIKIDVLKTESFGRVSISALSVSNTQDWTQDVELITSLVERLKGKINFDHTKENCKTISLLLPYYI